MLQNQTETSEKLQKVLARTGIGSRRQIETWIQAGRVRVNRETAHLGQRVNSHDVIYVDKRRIRMPRNQDKYPTVLCYHKPAGLICSRSDPENRPTIFQNLPKPPQGRWVSVGRLDLNTSGLLLLTNDGELANKLMHPAQALEREYAVRVLGKVNKDMIQRLRDGIELDDGVAKFQELSHAGGRGANQWYHAILTEGRQREVRRLWESQGVQVSRLIRIRYGSISLPSHLRSGKSEKLPLSAVKSLMRDAGLRS